VIRVNGKVPPKLEAFEHDLRIAIVAAVEGYRFRHLQCDARVMEESTRKATFLAKCSRFKNYLHLQLIYFMASPQQSALFAWLYCLNLAIFRLAADLTGFVLPWNAKGIPPVLSV
jgi:hypothetical protein